MDLSQIILQYIQQEDTDFAILINGTWGSGKTFYLKNEIADKLKSVSINIGKKQVPYEFVYLSLYGITSADDLQRKIFLAINPKLGTTGGKAATYIISKLADKLVGFDENDEAEILNIFGGIPKNRVLVFDDLERLNYDLLNEVLGFINLYTEHQNLKVVIIADEEKIRDTFGGDTKGYDRVKEKLIRFTYLFNPKLDAIIDSFISKYKVKEYQDFLFENKKLICDLFHRASHHNLRTLKFCLDLFVQIYNEAGDIQGVEKEYTNNILVRFLFSLITYSIVYKRDGDELFLKALAELSHEVGEVRVDVLMANMYADMADREAKRVGTPQGDKLSVFKKNLRDNYLKKDYATSYQHFDFVVKYVHSGDLNIGDLIACSKKMSDRLVEINQKPHYVLLDKLKTPLEMEDEEFTETIDRVLEYVEYGVYKLGEYADVFQLLLNLNLNGIVDAEINQVVTDRFKKGMRASQLHSEYEDRMNQKVYLNIQEPPNYFLTQIREYTCELNESLLVEKDKVEADLLLSYMAPGKIELFDDLLNSKVRDLRPYFIVKFMLPSDFLSKFLSLGNSDKMAIIKALNQAQSRLNYGVMLPELEFYEGLYKSVDSYLNMTTLPKVTKLCVQELREVMNGYIKALKEYS